ncbi:hypothetical protein BJ508DRAFT_333910 [Ascobolus immersus RN42]|uniref:Uncharacterized protein n=1 Tax=Ascobolus immersus RN42 TaxID=1160509 RepID=A0A3N4HJY2_ASCIM|nr:hypothetical protein BJ508DRAFT_333910 [Ascobolus immersus RN42]
MSSTIDDSDIDPRILENSRDTVNIHNTVQQTAQGLTPSRPHPQYIASSPPSIPQGSMYPPASPWIFNQAQVASSPTAHPSFGHQSSSHSGQLDEESEQSQVQQNLMYTQPPFAGFPPWMWSGPPQHHQGGPPAPSSNQQGHSAVPPAFPPYHPSYGWYPPMQPNTQMPVYHGHPNANATSASPTPNTTSTADQSKPSVPTIQPAESGPTVQSTSATPKPAALPESAKNLDLARMVNQNIAGSTDDENFNGGYNGKRFVYHVSSALPVAIRNRIVELEAARLAKPWEPVLYNSHMSVIGKSEFGKMDKGDKKRYTYGVPKGSSRGVMSQMRQTFELKLAEHWGDRASFSLQSSWGNYTDVQKAMVSYTLQTYCADTKGWPPQVSDQFAMDTIPERHRRVRDQLKKQKRLLDDGKHHSKPSTLSRQGSNLSGTGSPTPQAKEEPQVEDDLDEYFAEPTPRKKVKLSGKEVVLPMTGKFHVQWKNLPEQAMKVYPGFNRNALLSSYLHYEIDPLWSVWYVVIGRVDVLYGDGLLEDDESFDKLIRFLVARDGLLQLSLLSDIEEPQDDGASGETGARNPGEDGEEPDEHDESGKMHDEIGEKSHSLGEEPPEPKESGEKAIITGEKPEDAGKTVIMSGNDTTGVCDETKNDEVREVGDRMECDDDPSPPLRTNPEVSSTSPTIQEQTPVNGCNEEKANKETDNLPADRDSNRRSTSSLTPEPIPVPAAPKKEKMVTLKIPKLKKTLAAIGPEGDEAIAETTEAPKKARKAPVRKKTAKNSAALTDANADDGPSTPTPKTRTSARNKKQPADELPDSPRITATDGTDEQPNPVVIPRKAGRKPTANSKTKGKADEPALTAKQIESRNKLLQRN